MVESQMNTNDIAINMHQEENPWPESEGHNIMPCESKSLLIEKELTYQSCLMCKP